jgi:hypothetical protein
MLQAHVEYETTKRHYAHVDCPGHADYVKVCHEFSFFLDEQWRYISIFCSLWLHTMLSSIYIIAMITYKELKMQEVLETCSKSDGHMARILSYSLQEPYIHE